MTFRILLVSMDGMGAPALARACRRITDDTALAFPVGLEVLDPSLVEKKEGRARLERALASADVLLLAHLLEDRQADLVAELVRASVREDATVLALNSVGPAMALTRVGRFRMAGAADRPRQRRRGKVRGLFSRLVRGTNMREHLRTIMSLAPRALAFLPGRAKDLRTFLESYLAWIEGSEENLRDLVLRIAHRHHGRAHLAGTYRAPRRYPETGAWHPLVGRIVEGPAELERRLGLIDRPRVGLLFLRNQLLAGDTAHLAAIVASFEARGLAVLPVFGSIFDYRPVLDELRACGIDLLVSATGFPLVGGHAESRPAEAVESLVELDVPYFVTVPLAFQDLDTWRRNHHGLVPVQVALNVALPELDGAIEPWVVTGTAREGGPAGPREVERANLDLLAARAARWAKLRRTPNAEKRIAVTIFRFPPASGALGTAAYLDVFASLHRFLAALAADGYTVEVPGSSEEILAIFRSIEAGAEGDPAGTERPIRVDVRDHQRWARGLAEIERHWGEAPGSVLVDGNDLLVLALRFGNVLVGVQPGFGYDGDPMKLLFVRDASPTHAFALYHEYLREGFRADAVFHLGTHGALEFMPGKEAGLSSECWPVRLLGDLPNVYAYSVNNPAEGTIAKRRSMAVLVGHLTPPSREAGLYRSLRALKDLILSHRREEDPSRRAALFEAAVRLADESHLAPPAAGEIAQESLDRWLAALLDIERTLVPSGLHVLGRLPEGEERLDQLASAAAFDRPEEGFRSSLELVRREGEEPAKVIFEAARAGDGPAAERLREREGRARELVRELLAGGRPQTEERGRMAAFLTRMKADLAGGGEIEAALAALRGRYVRPGPGGDPVRNPRVLPTGRNHHALSPDSIPSPGAVAVARVTADRFLARARKDLGAWPDSVALVLWAMDNIKTGGESLALALELLGLSVGPDSLGRLRVLSPRPLSELCRPRIDVVVTVSGIFRDVFPGALALLDEAVRLVAALDEPEDENRVKKRVGALEAAGIAPEDARTRVFGNGPGAYGGNLNHALHAGAWETSADLAAVFRRRKSFAWVPGEGLVRREELFDRLAGEADCVLQAIDSVEIGLSDVDHYFDYLGGLSLLRRERTGREADVYLADTTTALGRVDRLEEVSAREARVKLLNPAWYEAMLAHGYQGVRELATRLENLHGLRTTTGRVEPWVYDEAVRTFLADPALARRLEDANPDAFRSLVHTLADARDRGLWSPDEGLSEILDSADLASAETAEFP
ncbi:MAG: magnesium chelatase subunit H [Planctomycetes bacterium]|nr:magnesium chelatase subunit H [Planctomycetota bacterium]